jgi:hypothetical protein
VGDVEGVIALGHLAVVAGRQDQELAALAAVRSGVAQIGHVPEEEVVEDPEGVGRALDDHRAVCEVEPDDGVDALGVGRQEQRPRVHQVSKIPTVPLTAPTSRRPSRMAWSEAMGRASRKAHAALEVEVVVDGVDGLRPSDSRRRTRGCRDASPRDPG